MDFLRTMVTFVLVFDLIVFVHEFGHYIMARRNGVRVHEFALGMGPAIVKKQRGETLWALRALPIGGFCKMEGEDSDTVGPESFNSKTPWQRFQIIVMGAVNNILLAFIIMLIMHLSFGVQTNVLASVVPDSPAAAAGLAPGDRLVKINDQSFLIWPQATMNISQATGDIRLNILRDGKAMEFNLTPVLDQSQGRKIVGITTEHSTNPLYITSYTVKELGYFAWTVVDFFRSLVVGKADLNNVAGPVGLVSVVGESARSGILDVLYLTALISLNLGVFNLLPFPALDGGRLVFILIELVRGKPLPPEKEGLVHTVGFILLLLLIAVVTMKDIFKLI